MRIAAQTQSQIVAKAVAIVDPAAGVYMFLRGGGGKNMSFGVVGEKK